MKDISDLVADGMTEYFDWWVQRYSEEFYGFVFFSTSLLEYGGCTVFTEQGLDRVVEKYQQDENFADESEESLRLSLRWSPCDSVHHMENESIFEVLNERLATATQGIYELEDDEFDQRTQQLYDLVIAGIREFRTRRIPLEKDDVLVTMLCGDQSPEEIAYFIEKCNSPLAARKYIEELELDESDDGE